MTSTQDIFPAPARDRADNNYRKENTMQYTHLVVHPQHADWERLAEQIYSRRCAAASAPEGTARPGGPSPSQAHLDAGAVYARRSQDCQRLAGRAHPPQQS